MPVAGPLGRKLTVGNAHLQGAGGVNPRILSTCVSLGAGGEAGAPLLEWFDDALVGDEAVLSAIGDREHAAARSVATSGGTAWQLEATSIWRVLVDASPDATPHGTSSSFHPVLGHPVIRSSALRGAARTLDPEKHDRLFGTAADGDEGGAGPVTVGDASPVRPVVLCWDVVTPHHSSYYTGDGWPVDWDEPVPVSRLAVAAGSTFRLFVTSPRSGLAEDAARLLSKVFEEGIGAASSNGYGYFTTNVTEVGP